MADIEKWITINGAHIPIIKGESKARAVSNFLKGKRNAQKNAVKSKLKGMFRNPESQDELQREILENSAKGILRNKRPTIKSVRTKETRKDEMHDKLYGEYKERSKERDAKAEEYDRKAEEAYNKGKDDKRWNYIGKRDDLYRKDYNDEQKTYEKIAREANKIDKEKPKTYKQKLDPIFKKKQYSDKKSITTPAGYFSPKELHERENKVKNMFKNYWYGKTDVMSLQKKKEQLIQSRQYTPYEIERLQYDASREYDREKAHNKTVSLKGVKTRKK